MKTKIILTICIAAFLVTGCKKKDEEKEETEKEKVTKVLTGNLWYQRLILTDNTQPGLDDDYRYPFAKPCEKDNVFKYNEDGKYLYNVGTDTCDGAESNPYYFNYRWEVSEDGKTLTIKDYGSDGVTFQDQEVYTLSKVQNDHLIMYQQYESNNYQVKRSWEYYSKP